MENVEKGEVRSKIGQRLKSVAIFEESGINFWGFGVKKVKKILRSLSFREFCRENGKKAGF
jgi:hypothetical protein